MTTTLFGRTLVSRAPARSLLEPRTAAVHVGLFETSTDVDNCAGRVGNMVRGLDNDLLAAFRTRYPTDVAFLSLKMLYTGAAVGKKAPATFDRDKKFYEAWRGWRQTFLDWKAAWDDGNETDASHILSADTYRDCDRYDLEAKDWYDRFVKFGIVPTGPKTTTPGAIPGIDPAIPPSGQKPTGILDSIVTIVKWGVVGMLVVGGILILKEV